MSVTTYRVLWVVFMVCFFVPAITISFQTAGMTPEDTYRAVLSKTGIPIVAAPLWAISLLIPYQFASLILTVFGVIPYVGMFLLFWVAAIVEPPFLQKMKSRQMLKASKANGPSVSEILDNALIDIERKR